jgi:hypothetical protein
MDEVEMTEPSAGTTDQCWIENKLYAGFRKDTPTWPLSGAFLKLPALPVVADSFVKVGGLFVHDNVGEIGERFKHF